MVSASRLIIDAMATSNAASWLMLSAVCAASVLLRMTWRMLLLFMLLLYLGKVECAIPWYSRLMNAEQNLIDAHSALVELESRTSAQRAERNRALKSALASGVTWKRAQEITELSPRGVQISIKDV